MTVTEVLKQRGWSNKGWEDGEKVCIAHAVEIVLKNNDMDSIRKYRIRDAIEQVTGEQQQPFLIGYWNDCIATYEDVMLVAKILDTEWGL